MGNLKPTKSFQNVQNIGVIKLENFSQKLDRIWRIFQEFGFIVDSLGSLKMPKKRLGTITLCIHATFHIKRAFYMKCCVIAQHNCSQTFLGHFYYWERSLLISHLPTKKPFQPLFCPPIYQFYNAYILDILK